MSVELPKDAEGCEIPLDTVALFNRDGKAYSIVRWIFTTDFDLSDGWSNKWRAIRERHNRATRGHAQGGLMDEIKLKPCPFCGGDAEIQQGKYQGLRTFYVSCLGCGARTDLEYAEEFAADLWNERVSYVD